MVGTMQSVWNRRPGGGTEILRGGVGGNKFGPGSYGYILI